MSSYMSAYGYKQTLAGLKITSALHPGADLSGGVAEGPFLTQLGHCNADRVGFFAARVGWLSLGLHDLTVGPLGVLRADCFV